MLRWVLETVDNGSIRKDVYQERTLWGDKEMLVVSRSICYTGQNLAKGRS